MRTYDKDFKINAVNLYKSSGNFLKKVTEELGLAISTLSQWVCDLFISINLSSFEIMVIL